MKQGGQGDAPQVDDGTAQGHAEHGADAHIAAGNHQQRRHDQQAHQQMDPSVGHPSRPRQPPVQPLDQHVEGVGPQIRFQKQRHAQVGDGQARQQQRHPDRQLSQPLSHQAAYPLTPPEAKPLTRFFSIPMKRITTGMMAKMEAAKRYCHSIIL